MRNKEMIFNYAFQRNCIEFALKAKPVRRYIPKNPLQYRLWAFATSPFCEYTVFIAILLNTTSLAMKFYKQPTAYTDFLDVLNQVFTYFFLVECILKLGAFRFKVSLTDVSLTGKYALKSFLSELFPWSMECLWLLHSCWILCRPGPGQNQCKFHRKLFSDKEFT